MKKIIFLVLALIAFSYTSAGAWVSGGWDSGGGSTAAAFDGTITETLGAELIVDGEFNDSANWNEGAGWAIVAGVMVHTPGNTAALAPQVAIVPTVGKTYKFQYQVTAWAAAGQTVNVAGLQMHNSTYPNATGTYTVYFVGYTGGDLAFIPATGGNFSIDNVSLREVTSDVTSSTGPLVIQSNLSDPKMSENGVVMRFNTTGGGTSVTKIGLLVDMTGTGTGTEYPLILRTDTSNKFIVDTNGKTTAIGGFDGASTPSTQDAFACNNATNTTYTYVKLDSLNADTAGPPSSTDCDAVGEVGRMTISSRYSATAEYALWICFQTGASAYTWHKVALAP